MAVIGLAMVLVAGACAVAAALLERDGRPGWPWAWSALLLAGAWLNLGIESSLPLTISFAHGALFAPLILRAAFQHALRRPPFWILPLAFALAAASSTLHALGLNAVALGFDLATGPPLLVYAAVVTKRAPDAIHQAVGGRYIPPVLLVLAATGTAHLLWFFRSGDVAYTPWLLVSVPALSLQLVSSISGANRRREQALRASEERFHQLAVGSQDAIAEVDAEGYLTYVSPNVRTLLGLEPADLVGRHLPRVITDLEARWPDALVSRWSGRAALLEKRLSGATHRVRDAQGRWHWLETHASPYRAPDGELRVLSVSRDITERVRAEEKLRASDERLREILSSLPDTRVVLLDRQGRIQRIFGEPQLERYGLSRQQAEGAIATEFVQLRGEDAVPGIALLREVFETGEQRHIQQELSLPAGKAVWDVRMKPLHEADGEVGYVIVVARDVTEQLRVQEEQRGLEAQLHLAQKRESLGLLAGGIAHDFNNLLVGVLGNAALALESAPGGSDVREALQEIVLSGERASELTHQLVAYAGDARTESHTVELSGLLREMARLLRAAVPKSANLSVELEDGLWVEGDSTQLQQVMMNLITNAAESLEGGSGTVRLRTGRMAADADFLAACQTVEGLDPGECAYFEVSDDGGGIEPEIQHRIFDPFFTTKLRGRGLGLAATQGIVRSHGGALRVESRPKRGTRVRVLLPCVARPAASPEAAPSATPNELSGTVLVVDDQPHVLRLAERMLGRLGLVAIPAEGGFEGLRVYRERADEIDAVLLDLTMPGMNGEELLHDLRAIRPDLPVVLMSGHSEQRIAERLVGRPRVTRLHKPFRLAVLAARLEEALRPAPPPAASAPPHRQG